MSGFDLVGHLDSGYLPVLIMVTAFDRHAIRAFEAGAVDYLLKPVSQERLRQAVERASHLCHHPKRIAENIAHLQHLAPALQPPRHQKIVGRSGHEYFLLNPDEVLAFHASGVPSPSSPLRRVIQPLRICGHSRNGKAAIAFGVSIATRW